MQILTRIHVRSVCGSISAISGLRKKKGLSVFHEGEEHQCSLEQVGEIAELASRTLEAYEIFMLHLTASRNTERKVNDVR